MRKTVIITGNQFPQRGYGKYYLFIVDIAFNLIKGENVFVPNIKSPKKIKEGLKEIGIKVKAKAEYKTEALRPKFDFVGNLIGWSGGEKKVKTGYYFKIKTSLPN